MVTVSLTSVPGGLVLCGAVPALYVGEGTEAPRVFDTVAYSALVWADLDMAAAYQGGEVDSFSEVFA